MESLGRSKAERHLNAKAKVGYESKRYLRLLPRSSAKVLARETWWSLEEHCCHQTNPSPAKAAKKLPAAPFVSSISSNSASPLLGCDSCILVCEAHPSLPPTSTWAQESRQ